MILDPSNDRIDGCRQRVTEQVIGKNYQYPCPALKEKMIVQFGSNDLITIVIGGDTMRSDQKANCVDGGWKGPRGAQVYIFTVIRARDANQIVGKKRKLRV